VIKPITDEYIRGMAGMAGTKGRLLKALKEELAPIFEKKFDCRIKLCPWNLNRDACKKFVSKRTTPRLT
jgi:hypothetical protein